MNPKSAFAKRQHADAVIEQGYLRAAPPRARPRTAT
jgi:hypothetical protein